jgi:hypothetical protein
MGYSTSDPSEILDDAQHGIATNIATHGGVFLGEGHGYASITGWIADNITNLGIDVLFIEFGYSDKQQLLDDYCAVTSNRIGSEEHCILRNFGFPATTHDHDPDCCKDAWDPDNFHDEWIRVIEAAAAANVNVIAINCPRQASVDWTHCVDGTHSNNHWANVINEYLRIEGNSDHKFAIYGGSWHGGRSLHDGDPGWQGEVNNLVRIGGLTENDFMHIKSYVFVPGAFSVLMYADGEPSSPATNEQCSGVVFLDGKGNSISTGLGAWSEPPCIKLWENDDFTTLEGFLGSGGGVDDELGEYLIFLNMCNEEGTGYLGYDCEPITQLEPPICTTIEILNFTRDYTKTENVTFKVSFSGSSMENWHYLIEPSPYPADFSPDEEGVELPTGTTQMSTDVTEISFERSARGFYLLKVWVVGQGGKILDRDYKHFGIFTQQGFCVMGSSNPNVNGYYTVRLPIPPMEEGVPGNIDRHGYDERQLWHNGHYWMWCKRTESSVLVGKWIIDAFGYGPGPEGADNIQSVTSGLQPWEATWPEDIIVTVDECEPTPTPISISSTPPPSGGSDPHITTFFGEKYDM